jgi:MFS family permease
MLIFFGIAFVYFIVLFLTSKKERNEIIKEEIHKPLKFLKEIHLWGKVGKIIFPMLIFTMLLFMIDSFFWTIGPLIAESETVIKPFGGILLTIYTIPSLFISWFIVPITKKYGKKKSGMVALLLSCLMLVLFAFGSNPFVLVLLIFTSSCLLSFSWPAMRGTYADYISESPQLEKEIAALEDFAGNIGYVIGPILAGIMADVLGNTSSFAFLGIFAGAVTVIMLFITPKSIEVKVAQKDLK